MNLRLAQTLADRSPDRARAMLESQQRAAVDAIETLVRLSRGIYPPLLTGAGLAPALEAAIDVSPLDVELDAAGIGRYPARLEAAAYFCCLEALQNATKHAGATRIRIRLRQEGDELVLTVEDNGTGFDADRQRLGVRAGQHARPHGGARRHPARRVERRGPGSGPASRRRAGSDVRAKIAWLLAALTLALTAVDIAVTSTYRTLLSQEAVAQHGFPFANGAVVGSALLGAVIVSRDGRHVIGWLLSLIGVVGALSLCTEAYSIWVVSEGGPGPSAWVRSLGLVVVADRRPVRDRHAGAAVPAGARRAAAVAAVAVRRRRQRRWACCAALSHSCPGTRRRSTSKVRTSGRSARAAFTVGFR